MYRSGHLVISRISDSVTLCFCRIFAFFKKKDSSKFMVALMLWYVVASYSISPPPRSSSV